MLDGGDSSWLTGVLRSLQADSAILVVDMVSLAILVVDMVSLAILVVDILKFYLYSLVPKVGRTTFSHRSLGLQLF